MTVQPTKAGFVALIGEPNAGKSTLLNHMVGAKVSIVTHKVQTTRARIRGVALEGEANWCSWIRPVCSNQNADLIAQWLRQLGAGLRMRMSSF